MRRSILVVIIAVIIVSSGALILVYGFHLLSADYNLEIDPLKDEQNLFRYLPESHCPIQVSFLSPT